VLANKAAAIHKHCDDKKLSEEVKIRQLSSLTYGDGNVKLEDLCLTFTLPGNGDIELVKGGKDREVDVSGAQDFVDLVLHYYFHETVKL